MKILIYISVFAMSACVNSIPPPNCNGFYCGPACKSDEYLYSSRCDYLQPEPTCTDPYPPRDMRGMLCDYMKCYCKSPKVRDETTGTCVEVEDCPGVWEDCSCGYDDAEDNDGRV